MLMKISANAEVKSISRIIFPLLVMYPGISLRKSTIIGAHLDIEQMYFFSSLITKMSSEAVGNI